MDTAASQQRGSLQALEVQPLMNNTRIPNLSCCLWLTFHMPPALGAMALCAGHSLWMCDLSQEKHHFPPP